MSTLQFLLVWAKFRLHLLRKNHQASMLSCFLAHGMIPKTRFRRRKSDKADVTVTSALIRFLDKHPDIPAGLFQSCNTAVVDALACAIRVFRRDQNLPETDRTFQDGDWTRLAHGLKRIVRERYVSVAYASGKRPGRVHPGVHDLLGLISPIQKIVVPELTCRSISRAREQYVVFVKARQACQPADEAEWAEIHEALEDLYHVRAAEPEPVVLSENQIAEALANR